MSFVSDEYDNIDAHFQYINPKMCIENGKHYILIGWKHIKFKSSIMLNPNL